MMYCPNCNKELEDGALFCDGCGAQVTVEAAAPVAETVFCGQCGQQTDASAPYCQNCGAPLEGVAPAPAAKKGLPKKALLFGGIAVVAIAAIIAIVLLIFGGGRNNDYVAYFKDGELFFNAFKDESVEVTSKLLDGDFMTKDMLADTDDFSRYIQMSADGKTMFYPDKVDRKDGVTIYYRDVTKADSEATKISADVDYYFINNKGDKILYSKDETLYVGSVDEPVKVASDVSYEAITADFETVIYSESEEVKEKNEEGYDETHYEYTFYLWNDGEKEKIVSGKISDFRILDKVTDDGYKKLSKVCYVKEDVLYIMELGEEAEKIDSDVISVEKIYESGEIYYAKKGEELKYVDYINNDNKTEISDEQKKETFGETRNLYCYDDGESVLIAEGYDYASFAAEKPVAVIKSVNYSSIKKVKLSEFEDAYWGPFDAACNEIRNKYWDLEATRSVLAEGALTEIDLDDINSTTITKDGSEIYFFCVGNKEEKDEEGNVISSEPKDKGDIYLVTVKKATVNAPEEYDTDVSVLNGEINGTYVSSISRNRNDDLVYYKNYKSENGKTKADLFVAQEEIDSDVLPGSVSTLNNGAFVYYVDYNGEYDKQCGTLKIYKKGEATVIADDVYDYIVTPDNEVLYLTEYNVEKSRGELYRYNNGKNNFIDEDVIGVLDIYVWEED